MNFPKTARNFNLFGLLFFFITLVMIYTYGMAIRMSSIIPPIIFLILAVISIITSYFCRYKAKKMCERERFVSTGAGKTVYQAKVLLNDEDEK